jgi:hypothetical protein
MNARGYLLLVLLPLLGAMGGCAGTLPLASGSRAGDTIVLGAGWKQKFDHNSLTVTITDYNNIVTTYPPGSPSLRAVINLYPDPLSYIVVGTRTGLSTGYNYGAIYGSTTNNITHYDPDWWQTSIYLDLPPSMAVGTAQVSFSSANGETYGPIPVVVIAGVGSPSTFDAAGLGPMQPVQLQSLERAPLSIVRFSGGTTLASSIQIDLTHAPDSSVGGTGKTFVVNPRGEMKNLSWTDNGTNLRVLLTTSGDGTTKDPKLNNYMWKYFKFYVTGGVTGVTVQTVKAYDINGALMSGVSASVTAQ